ncbi:hypothetical protein LAZ67_22000573 [Cordylochernes scorpioides]|uniref:Reverse transcriptase zinc-binding domain-containing protein n=1 Tax=Cordylochernes scorpioides TaxID=51811 RepID=A0ABY6LNB1_9ARAC|nr:hypothetical protein LAZ67_22000573 [Cordylochernes scorpioides]
MKLIAFDFKLQYKPGKYLIVADTLSRDTHPMDELPTPFLEDKRMVKMNQLPPPQKLNIRSATDIFHTIIRIRAVALWATAINVPPSHGPTRVADASQNTWQASLSSRPFKFYLILTILLRGMPMCRLKEATKKMYQKLLDSPVLEINPILQSPPKHRLKSRKPIWSRGNQLLSQNFNISEAWTNSWISSDIPNKNLITSPSVKIPGFSLPRREWVLLNRFRTGQGRCAELMKLWGYTKDPNCACNVPQSMSHILDDCPLYKFNGRISNLHSVTPEALNWLKALPLRL